MKIFEEFENTPAYAKIQSLNFCKFLTKRNIFLGREISVVESIPDSEFIFISNSNKISRKHVNIYWDEFKYGWYAKNLSKNPIVIDGITIKSTSDPLKLSNISTFVIDDCKFYFFEAKEE